MRIVLSAIILGPALAAGAGAPPIAPRTVFHGKEEILQLDELAAPLRWRPAECTVTAGADSGVPALPGRAVLHLHIPVDYHAGEKKYPVGWPRMYCTLQRPTETRWSAYDRFEFQVYTRMSRPKPPSRPLTFQVLSRAGGRRFTPELTALRIGRWVRFSFPTSKIPAVEEVERLGFNIAESNYHDGDRLDFYIGGFQLVRSTECRLDSLRIAAPVVYRGQAMLPVDLVVVGPPHKVARGIPFEIRRGAAALRRETLPVHRGKQRLRMGIAELKLPPGDYLLIAFPGVGGKEKRASFRVVEAPWAATPP